MSYTSAPADVVAAILGLEAAMSICATIYNADMVPLDGWCRGERRRRNLNRWKRRPPSWLRRVQSAASAGAAT